MRVHRSGARRPRNQQSSIHRKDLDFNRICSQSRPKGTSDRIGEGDLAPSCEGASKPVKPSLLTRSNNSWFSASTSVPRSTSGGYDFDNHVVFFLRYARIL